MANDVISMIKGTSIASVIFVNELTFRSQQIVGQNFKFLHRLRRRRHHLSLHDQRGRHRAGLARAPLQSRDRSQRWARFGLRQPVRLLALQPDGPRPKASPPRRCRLPPAQTPTPAEPRLARLDPQHHRLRTGDEPAPAPFVVFRNVHKAYGSREVLRGIDLDVRKGEVVVIMGPSGSGKSTLLRLVNHLETLDWGEIHGRKANMSATACVTRCCARRETSPRRAPTRASAWCSSTSTCSII